MRSHLLWSVAASRGPAMRLSWRTGSTARCGNTPPLVPCPDDDSNTDTDADTGTDTSTDKGTDTDTDTDTGTD